ncbi:type III secretion system inner membrane ring subunit SctD [Candidatus Sororendozoicomonas aggregata]|uniref:type III secretion system inner membrane ring subunit SctD n=1 Tax=Candidatus Sororendozoicomonas aggregata TaxID=3073239 RepID=UPI002ED43016
MSNYYLKILSGNHLGAEIPLEPGQYSLGSAENCDLILSDASVIDLEIILSISDDGQFSISTDSPHPLYLNGEPGNQALTPSAFDVITFGGIHIALGSADEKWPDITVPEIKKADEQTADNPDENNDFPDPDVDEPAAVDTDTDETERLSASEDEEGLNVDPRLFIALPALFLVLMTAFGVYLFSETEEVRPVATISPVDQANRLKSRLQLKDIKFRSLPDGTLLMTGYTQSREQKDAMIKALKDNRLSYRSQVIAMTEMQANAEALLKSRGYQHLGIEIDNTPGSLILTGYLVSADQLDKVSALLIEEVYGLQSIVDQVENQAGRLNILKAMIRDKALASRVHIIERPGKLLIQGLLMDEGQEYKLREVATRFKARYNNQPAVIIATSQARVSQFNGQSGIVNGSTDNTFTALSSGAQKRNGMAQIVVRGVSMGTIPYVIMDDGGKYLIGARLDNGYIIEDINLDYLLLSSGAQSIKYLLGGKSSDQTKP